MPRPRTNDRVVLLEDDACDDRVIHMDAVKATRAAQPATTTLLDVADLFAAMGDATRIRILSALAHTELCVCDLAATVRISESAVSHHLRLLRRLGIVSSRRAGRLVYYALDDDHVRQLVVQGLDHVNHRRESR